MRPRAAIRCLVSSNSAFGVLDMKKLPWRWHDYRTDVPKWLTAGIGTVMVEWAVFERELQELIRLLIDVSGQTGRIITKRMNAQNRFQVAANLLQAHVYDERVKPQFLKEFSTFRRKTFEPIESKRDMLAHGLWDRENEKWCVLWLAEARKIPKLNPDIPSLSRAVLPQIIPVTEDDLRKIAADIAGATGELVDFCGRLRAALPPSQHKPPGYSRRQRNHRPTKG